jgi:hypothetical protein
MEKHPAASAGIHDGHKTGQKTVGKFNGETPAAWMTLMLRTILPQKATFFPMEMEDITRVRPAVLLEL